MTVDCARTALVVVDMPYGDAHRDFGLLKEKREAGQLETVETYARRLDDLVVPHIQRLLTAFRDNGGEVIFCPHRITQPSMVVTACDALERGFVTLVVEDATAR